MGCYFSLSPFSDLEDFKTQDFLVDNVEEYEDTKGSLRVLGIYFGTMHHLHIDSPAPPPAEL